jgi:hypothetical protein
MKTPKMTANRIEVTSYIDIYTQESMENGEVDRTDTDSRWVFDSLEDAAEHIAYEIQCHGLDCDGGNYTVMYGEAYCANYYTGEDHINSTHVNFGKNLQTAEIKDKLECLVWDNLVTVHGYNESTAWRKLGYIREERQVVGHSSSGAAPMTYPKLYLVR